MAPRHSAVASSTPLLLREGGWKTYLNDACDPITEVKRSFKLAMLVLYFGGMIAMMIGCLLVAFVPDTLFAVLGFGVYVAVGLGLLVLGFAIRTAKGIWTSGTTLNRFSLIAAPASAGLLVWDNKAIVMHATDTLGGLLYNDGLYMKGANIVISTALTIIVQALVWAVQFGLPVAAIHGLSMNKFVINNDDNKLTDREAGTAQTVFYHVVAGYGFTLLAICAWLPFFVVAAS